MRVRYYLFDRQRLDKAAEKVEGECKACHTKIRGARDIIGHMLRCKRIPLDERKLLLDWLAQIARLPDSAFEHWLSEPGNFEFLLREGIVRPINDGVGQA